ncbi:MAG TPA: MFS transporter [Candidatus Tumulicola sp.]|jgi:MFS family permease
MIRKLLPILGITFIDILGFSMLIPMLPYFVTHFGASAVVVGLLFAAFSACQLIAAPLWGRVSDIIGRKMVLIVSQIGATIGWSMLAFAPTIGWVFFARIVEGISGGNISVTQAYVADLVEAKDRSRAFGLIGATFAAAMIFGPFGGGLLFARFGFAAPFLTAAGLQFLTLLLTIFALPESRSHNKDEEAPGVGSLMASFKKPRLSRILWQKLAVSLGLYGWFSVIALYLSHQLGFSLTQTDYFFSFFAVFNVLSNVFLVGRMSQWLGDRTMSNVGLAALVLAFASVAMVHSIWGLAVTMLLFAFGMALANTGITALISNAASDREQGVVLGASSSLDSLSGILAPPVSTGLLGRYGSSFAGLEPLVFEAAALVLGLIAARVERDVPELVQKPDKLDDNIEVLSAESAR